MLIVVGTSLESVGPFSRRIADGVLYISWYDHKGIIMTNGLNLAKYFDYYLALLFILQRFDRSDWGQLEDENLRSDRNRTNDETRISVENKEFTSDMNVEVIRCWGMSSSSIGKKQHGNQNGLFCKRFASALRTRTQSS